MTLRLFVAITEEQSIAKAADREHIAASAISKRISDLEEVLGTPLLNRLHKGIDLTPAGRALLHHARTIIRDLARLEGELIGYSKGTRGYVRIFANESTMLSYLPEELSGFLTEFPMVHIEFSAGVSPGIVQAVSENAADIGILPAIFRLRTWRSFPIIETMWSLSSREGIHLPQRPLSVWSIFWTTRSSIRKNEVPLRHCCFAPRQLSDAH